MLVGVGVLVLWPLAVVAARVVFGDDPASNFSELIAIQLVIVGAAIAFGALYLVILEFRGRALAAALSEEGAEVRQRGLGTEAIKATPEILKAFGQLKPVAALLVVSALLFICASVLAWRGLET
jgi:hypothetical protein